MAKELTGASVKDQIPKEFLEDGTRTLEKRAEQMKLILKRTNRDLWFLHASEVPNSIFPDGEVAYFDIVYNPDITRWVNEHIERVAVTVWKDTRSQNPQLGKFMYTADELSKVAIAHLGEHRHVDPSGMM